VIRDNTSSDQAKKFSSLYTRLLTQPVLSQKWGVLKFLLELSGSREEGGHAAGATISVHSSGDRAPEDSDEQVVTAAFSGQGLHRLPVREAPQTVGDPGYEGGNQAGMPTKAEILAARGDGIGTSKIRVSLDRAVTDLKNI
jgi:gamma-tubulin complex component 3